MPRKAARGKTVDADTPVAQDAIPAEPAQLIEPAEPAENLSGDDFDDLLVADEEIAVEEPDESELFMEANELESLEKDDTLELLKTPTATVELGEDPVRLYLKEIGEIELLDADREFWLAVRIEANRRADAIARTHPLARRSDFFPRGVIHAFFDELSTNWKQYPPGVGTMKYGDAFIQSAAYCVLKVPSCIVEKEYNLLINPQHPEARQIKIIRIEPFPFDPRLIRP